MDNHEPKLPKVLKKLLDWKSKFLVNLSYFAIVLTDFSFLQQ